MLEGVDVSYAQGNYRPGAESFVIVNASRANIGLAVGSEYRNQVANARAAGKHVGHYFFNGNIDPVVCADYFVANLLYQPGDSLWLDSEAEAGTGTVAWNPQKSLAFINRVKAHGLPAPGMYLNRSLMDGFDWSAVVAAGAALWIAYYNPAPPPIRWWPTWTLWQYTSTPIDRNKAQVASLAELGSNPLEDDLTPDQDRKLTSIFNALFSGGNSMKDGGKSVSQSLAEIHASTVKVDPVFDAVFRGGNSMLDDKKSISQSLAEIHAASTPGAGIDYDALGTAIVSKLPAASLTKQDVIDALKSVSFKAEG